MRQRRFAITAVMAAALTLVMGACSSSGEAAPPPKTTTTVTTAPTTTATVAAEPEEEEPAPVDTTPTEVYTQDFEQLIESEWSRLDIATTADGRTVLGPFGDDRVTLQLIDLPPHESLSISFDLLVLGNWTGGEENGDRWLMTVDSTQVMNTTFANTEAEQAFPADLPAGGNPGGTGASEVAWYGLTGDSPESEMFDKLYPVEREFLHTAAGLTVDFSARQLGLFDDQAWAIDNVSIVTSALPNRRPVTDVAFSVIGQAMSVSGTVPTEEDQAYLREAVEFRFGEQSSFEDLTVGRGGPRPLWLYDVASIATLLAPSDDVSLQADETSASASGTVRTSQWADAYGERLEEIFGETIQPSINFGLAFDDAFVNKLDGLDLLFESTNGELDDADRENLDEVAELLTENEGLILRINGHTDSTGEDDGNKNLSRDRADAAFDYLVGAGIDKDRLTANARGDSDLKVDPERSEADRAANRRVSFVIPRG